MERRAAPDHPLPGSGSKTREARWRLDAWQGAGVRAPPVAKAPRGEVGRFLGILLRREDPPVVKAWSRKSREQRRAEILAAARQLVLETGDASMTEVAEVAGVSRATLYQHFPSREVLLRDFLDEALVEPRRAAAAEAGRSGPLADRITSVLEAYPGAILEVVYRSKAGPAVLDLAERLGFDLLGREARRTVELLASLLRAAERDAELDLGREGFTPEALAETLFASASGLARPFGGILSPALYRARLRFLVGAALERAAAKDL